MKKIIEGHSGVSRRNIYIALEDFNFFWSKEEIMGTIELWLEGCSLSLMSRYVKRLEDEIALLIISVNSHRKIFLPRAHDATKNTRPVKLTKHYEEQILAKFVSSIKHGYEVFENNMKIDFVWDEDQVIEFERLWSEGVNVLTIQEHFKRQSIIDIAILIIDRCRKGYIEPRKEGLEGITSGCPIRSSSKSKGNKIA
jgi:hypothetical protein